jgi:hypothetical protein
MSLHLLAHLAPHPSLNADVPRAGLRPRGGPPVSLFRWVSRKLAEGSEHMTRKLAVFVLICLSVALVAASLPTQAQPASKIARVGRLAAPAAAGNADFVEGFREGLRHLGYNEGRNIVIEFRFADGQMDRPSASETNRFLVQTEVKPNLAIERTRRFGRSSFEGLWRRAAHLGR